MTCLSVITQFLKFEFGLTQFFLKHGCKSNIFGNKKVLLHERKRHTDCCVACTHCAVPAGYTPSQDRVSPQPGQGTPPGQGTSQTGYPPAKTGYPPWPGQGTPLARTGYPPSQDKVPPGQDRVPLDRVPPGQDRVPPDRVLPGEGTPPHQILTNRHL